MSHGPNPWQQQSWDWRAATNFVAGGAGSGLIAAAALFSTPAPLLAGVGLVGVGLLAVFLELGRPWRAINVLANARTSWMSREAIVAPGLAASAVAAALGVPGAATAAVLLALGFTYCQGRIVCAARGIPAWREPLIVPLFLATGLAEGFGLWLLLQAFDQRVPRAAWALFGAALVARWLLWQAWRRRVKAAPRALAQIDRAGTVVHALTLLPLAMAAVAITTPPPQPLALVLQAAAGLLAAAGGAWFKFTLITRAGFNQGYAIAHVPVRGARPSAESGRWA
jgi:phenylacetyl-CoA:acceptor oxidoreductase subunit 2